MTDEQQAATMPDEAVAAFGRKLAQWSEQLTAQERAILCATLARAVACRDDVLGYDTFTRPTGFVISPGAFGALLDAFNSGGGGGGGGDRRRDDR